MSEPVSKSVDTSDELLTRLENGVLWLTINRADKGNAIPYYVRDRLTQWFWDAHSDLDVRAIVLTGAGERHFCTGADLSVRQPAGKPKPEGAPDMVVGGATQMMRLGFQRLMQAMLDFAVRLKPPANAQEASGAPGEFFWDGAANTLFWVDPKNKITAVLFTQYKPFGKVPLHKAFRDAVYSKIPDALAH